MLPEEEQGPAIEARDAELQTTLDLGNELLRVALFHLGPQRPNRLLLAIHHLAIDGVSWRILLQDLLTAYHQVLRGQPLQLPVKTTAFKHWAEKLLAHAHSGALQQEQAYWLDESRSQVGRLPVDHADGINTRDTARRIRTALSAADTQALLQEVPTVYRTQVNEVLLSALVRAFARWSGRDSLLVDLEGHGREDLFPEIDLSRTVGWFTTIFPVVLDLEGTRDPCKALRVIKEQMRQVPNRGLGYGLLRYLSRDDGLAQRLAALPQAEVSFNYLGQLDRVLPEAVPLTLARESSGPQASLRGRRKYLLEIDGEALGGQLQFTWTYSPKIHRQATIEGLAQGFVEALQSLISHCRSAEAESFTPSDFPLARLNQEQLGSLARLVNFVDAN